MVQEVAQCLNSEESVVATPHAQRSVVNFKVRLKNANSAPDLVELIDLVEAALKTPVQAAVKRADEQEFARLNAQQLMFCEDAGRVVQEQFEKDPRFVDYWAHISHQESLHPHDAVSCISKGVPGGWSAESTHV
jgi:GTP cyclohydrolase I